MRLIDLYPAQGTFAPGDMITLIAEIAAASAETESTEAVIGQVSITHLASPIATLTIPISPTPGRQKITLNWRPPAIAPRGYGVDVEWIGHAGQVLAMASTAFDVLDRWTQSPR